jgi:hypothetical protein
MATELFWCGGGLKNWAAGCGPAAWKLLFGGSHLPWIGFGVELTQSWRLINNDGIQDHEDD